MVNKVTLYGASGHAKVVIAILEQVPTAVALIIDDNPNVTQIMGKTVVAASEVALDKLEQVIIAIGNNKVRKMLSEQLPVSFATAIHPNATIATATAIGAGTVVMAGAVINPESFIGKHCIINTGAIIEHEVRIDDFVHICPRVALAGNVTVGEGTQVGIGAVVIQGVTIGKWAVIGAGAVVLGTVPDYAVVVGNPGKIIKYTH
jgi:acetyltransferase EpsM